ncbi:MAG: alpha/beta fold hydrolase [Actinomycetota bacterium]|nr:alpha/beta fold hydrolase [Actinomycetota bacterium]
MGRRLQISDLLDQVWPEDIALDPGGQLICFVQHSVDQRADRDLRSLWLVDRSDSAGTPAQLSFGLNDRAPSWSPDGQWLAFLREDADATASQLWLLGLDQQQPRQLTGLPLGAGRAVWSPDGRRIAFRARVASPTSGPAIVARRVDYQSDGEPPVKDTRWHLHLIEVETGELRQLTHGDWDASDPSWSPDGTTVAFVGNAEPDADLLAWTSPYLIAVDSPAAEPALLGSPAVRLGGLSWHPDGRSLLAVGRLDTSVGLAQLFRIPLADGVAQQLTDADRSVATGGEGSPGGTPQFVAGGQRVVYAIRDGGDAPLCVLDLACGQVDRLTEPGTSVLGLSVSDLSVSGLSVPDLSVPGLSVPDLSGSAGSHAAVILATPSLFGELATIELSTGNTQWLTTLQQQSLPEVELYTPVRHSFAISDGGSVEGWLLSDPATPGPKPLLLDLHGGPHNAWGAFADRLNLGRQLLVAQGWAVLTVNPRASDGYGEAFLRGALGKWGESDIADVLEPIDALVADGTADPGRLAVTGHSYGGYLACYLTAHDSRFAAAVIAAPVTDLRSLIGTSDLGGYVAAREFSASGLVTGAALDRLSPISSVGRVRTPTLLLHGTADLRCPIGQSQQWFVALRHLGVPVELVRYPGEDHNLSATPSHRLDLVRRTIGWLSEHTARSRPAEPRAAETERWQRLLVRLADLHEVPGAVLGVLRRTPSGEAEVSTLATGVLSINTGAPVTPDSVFQIGSITKVWTAAMVLQLRDEGLLDLDASLAELLPDLVLSEPGLPAQMTPRHLLSHTSGLDGDLYFDTGRGAEAIGRLAERLRDIPQLFAPGETWSYSNTGYVLAAHLIERLTGQSWDSAIRNRLIDRLGLLSTVTFPEDALLLEVATGHVRLPGKQLSTTPIWGLPRSLAPAGVINSSAADLLTFARMLISDGRDAQGQQVLSPRSIEELYGPYVRLPEIFPAVDSWGMGLTSIYGYDQPVYGHDGAMIGQSGYLRLLPGHDLAVTLLANGGNAGALFEQLFHTIADQLAGLGRLPAPTPPVAVPATAAELAGYAGRYLREGKIIEVTPDETGLHVHVTSTVELIKLVMGEVHEYHLEPIAGGLFHARGLDGQDAGPAALFQTASGRQLLHLGMRATPRVS